MVGLGAAGLTALCELRTAGATAVGLDAGLVGDGASGRNGGFLLAGLAAFHHVATRVLGSERSSALYRLTMDERDRTVRSTPGVRRTGSLRIAVDDQEEQDCAEQQRVMRTDGLPVEAYEGPEGRGLRFPLDATFDPGARCRHLAEQARRAGAALHEHSPVTAISSGEVRALDGVVRCSAVLVCVDGGLELLLPELEGTVRTARAQMLATAPEPAAVLPTPVYARWGYDYWQQLPDGRVALGGGRDVGGEAEWCAEAVPSAAVQAHLDGLLATIRVRAPVTHRWAGLLGFSRGVLPTFAEVRPGVMALGGYSGTGNLVGPLLARAAVRRVLEGDDGFGDLLSAPAG